ncbi:hypothetical protein FA95DRAFT_1413636 [Auriscalpium vulgare]|uniref:Uncharacterized protein n=1 Tax=Auriscalpium vulgare TaxID=40419 RepID=A0ACB8RQ28_9AGAM|nr:hypothetical protein FA95DRAFT_1413636 [Auriscalpium vulgare]
MAVAGGFILRLELQLTLVRAAQRQMLMPLLRTNRTLPNLLQRTVSLTSHHGNRKAFISLTLLAASIRCERPSVRRVSSCTWGR